MKQPALLSFVPLSVTEWVQDRLRGFELRHAARVAKRKQDRARLAAMPEDQKRKRVSGMRVIFRAEFQGPKGPLNPMGLNMSRLTMQVDVFREGTHWYGRSNKNKLKLPGEPTHGCAKDAVEAAFEKRLTPWILCDAGDGLPIDPDYVEETPEGKFCMREVTHCGSRDPNHLRQTMDTQPKSKGPNYYIAACGVEAHASLIRSFRAPHPPLCKECRKEWEKTPAEERFKS